MKIGSKAALISIMAAAFGQPSYLPHARKSPAPRRAAKCKSAGHVWRLGRGEVLGSPAYDVPGDLAVWRCARCGSVEFRAYKRADSNLPPVNEKPGNPIWKRRRALRERRAA